MKSLCSLLGSILLLASQAHAVTLLDHDEWKVNMSGFVESDIVSDSRRSFDEVVSNKPVDQPNTYGGDNGRLFMSNRNSRLAFAVLPPVQDGVTSKGYFEFDFLGYDPSVSSSNAPTNSESSFYSSPTLRIRHAYLSASHDDWNFLVGQTWSLFGWQPNYVLTTASVSPGPAILFQRTMQFTAMKTMAVGEEGKLTTAASAARPTQRDSQVPNLDLGIRYNMGGRKSAFSAATSDGSLEALSVGLSGTFRQYETPESATDTHGTKIYNGSGFAADVLVPIVAASGEDRSNTLTWTAEYVSGKGLGDEYPGWSGNLSQMPTGAGIANKTNMDTGIAGFDGNGDFHLIKTETMTTQLQYTFAQETHSFMTIGASQLHAYSMAQFSPAAGKVVYDHTSFYYINYFKDLTKQIRVAAEYEKIATHYVDTTNAFNDRYQLSAYLRF
jgi:hypothetical protein